MFTKLPVSYLYVRIREQQKNFMYKVLKIALKPLMELNLSQSIYLRNLRCTGEERESSSLNEMFMIPFKVNVFNLLPLKS